MTLPADDPLDDLQVVEPPQDGALVPGHQLLGELIEIFQAVSPARRHRSVAGRGVASRRSKASPSGGESLVQAWEARRVEARAVAERRPDDGVVRRRHVLEHVSWLVDVLQRVARPPDAAGRGRGMSVVDERGVAASSSVQASFSQISDDWWTAWKRCSSR